MLRKDDQQASYDENMSTPDRSSKASELIEQARARWPRWRNSTLKPAPRWFRGEELDVLEPGERDKLYRDTAVGPMQATWVLPILALGNLSNMIRGLRSEHDRWPWIVFATVFVLLMVAAPFLRRRAILKGARRSLRESSNWPLTRLNRFGEGAGVPDVEEE